MSVNKELLIEIIDQLEEKFQERKRVIRGVLLALLSKEHVLLLGKPGTAKSLLVEHFCSMLDANFFRYLLTKYTTQDELFGPLSLKALENDKYERKIEDYLPNVHIAFLDEIFRANSTILNALLTLLNERLFMNGNLKIKVPLISLIAASNELPEGEQLQALYDRFLFRFEVHPIQDKDNFVKMLQMTQISTESMKKLDIDNIHGVQEQRHDMKLSEENKQIMLKLWKKLAKKNIEISDRRWKKIIHVLKLAASINEDPITPPYFILSRDMLWNTPEQYQLVDEIILSTLVSGGVDIEELQQELYMLGKLLISEIAVKFKKKVECMHCSTTLYTKKSLEEHVNTQEHYPRCPECRYEFQTVDNFLQHLLEKHNWEIKNELGPERLSQYNSRTSKINEELMKKSLWDSQESFQMDNNIWLNKVDKLRIVSERALFVQNREIMKEKLKKIETLLSQINEYTGRNDSAMTKRIEQIIQDYS